MNKVLAAILLAALAAGGILLLHGHRESGGGGVLVDPRMEALVRGAPQSLRVSVEGIPSEGARFPREFTCDGRDRPPTVTISGVPAGARAVALIMYDPDAPIGTFIHWLAIAPPAETVTLPSTDAVEGVNDFRRIGYGGPCPPRGHGPHRYYFLALALDRDPGLPRGFTVDGLLAAAKGHVIAWGYMMGTYERR